MPYARRMAATLVAVALSFQGIRGAEAPSPLRLIPEDVDLLVRVPQVRRVAVDVTQLEVLHKLEALSGFREALGSTRFHNRRLCNHAAPRRLRSPLERGTTPQPRSTRSSPSPSTARSKPALLAIK